MTKRLCHLLDMEHNGYMIFAADGNPLLIHFDQPGIIPAFSFIDQNTRFAGLLLKTHQNIRDTAFSSLVFLRNRYTISVIID